MLQQQQQQQQQATIQRKNLSVSEISIKNEKEDNNKKKN